MSEYGLQVLQTIFSGIGTLAGVATFVRMILEGRKPPESRRYWPWLVALGFIAVIVAAQGVAVFRVTEGASQTNVDLSQFNSMKMKPILSQTYRNQTLHIDGKEYIDCTFDNVTFIYEGKAPFQFTEAHFPNGTTIQFGSPNPAINTALHLLGSLQDVPHGQVYHEFLAPEDVR
jgi:hypothetical protein